MISIIYIIALTPINLITIRTMAELEELKQFIEKCGSFDTQDMTAYETVYNCVRTYVCSGSELKADIPEGFNPGNNSNINV